MSEQNEYLTLDEVFDLLEGTPVTNLDELAPGVFVAYYPPDKAASVLKATQAIPGLELLSEAEVGFVWSDGESPREVSQFLFRVKRRQPDGQTPGTDAG